MPRTLIAENGAPYVVGSTDTVKPAKRVIETGRVIARSLPEGYVSTSMIGLLLALYLAEEDARYMTVIELSRAADAPFPVVTRWFDALRRIDLVEELNGLVALTDDGYSTVMALSRTSSPPWHLRRRIMPMPPAFGFRAARPPRRPAP